MLIKSASELCHMRQAGLIVRATKVKIKDAITPGVSTEELDSMAEKEIRKLGGLPSLSLIHI